MVRGIDSTAVGMMSLLELNDINANNLANINTPGFKKTMATFKNIQDLAITQTGTSLETNSSNKILGTLSAGSVLDSSLLNFEQGGLKQTGNPLDCAINGDGFFAIQTPNGEAYTRNGSFLRNIDGYITTSEGYQLMGQNGPINIADKEAKNIQIDTEGNIRLNNSTIDKIKIVDFENKKNIKAAGHSTFELIDKTEQSITPKRFEIAQGTIESSNANAVESMINSINCSRTYETMSKMIETNKRTLDKAINSVGKIRA